MPTPPPLALPAGALSIPAGYALRRGCALDRPLLLQWLSRTYAELRPAGNWRGALAEFVSSYFCADTPLFWMEAIETPLTPQRVGGVWLSWGRDFSSGDRQAQILWLYVAPQHRRRGIGRALLACAEAESGERGTQRVGLSVLADNAGAIALYQASGYHIESLAMVKTV